MDLNLLIISHLQFSFFFPSSKIAFSGAVHKQVSVFFAFLHYMKATLTQVSKPSSVRIPTP